MNVVQMKDSESLELSSYTLHSDVGPLLIGVWYRPPRRGDKSAIQIFDKELEEYQDFAGRIIVGDMNVHNERWLKFSKGESPEGLELESVCAAHGLKQHVKSATRDEYLLDLVLSDLGEQIRCSVHPGVLESDHRCVIANIDISIAVSVPCSRTCFDFGKAQWAELRNAFRNIDWRTFFVNKDSDTASLDFTNYVLSMSNMFILFFLFTIHEVEPILTTRASRQVDVVTRPVEWARSSPRL